MSSKFPRAPKYCRQKETGRPDRAYVVIDGKRFSLGAFGSPASYKLYAELISGERKAEKPVVAPATPAPPTVSVVLASFLEYAIAKYGGPKALGGPILRESTRSS
jgi:hypothetical protein